MTDVFVVIAQYNHVELTVQAIASLESQIDLGHVIVVDGGSVDDINLLRRFPIIFIQESQNLGYGHLINVGLWRAAQEGASISLILNNDVIVGADLIKELVCDVKELNYNVVVSPVINDRNGNVWFAGGRRSSLRGNVYHRTTESNCHLDRSDFLSGCCMAIPTNVIQRVGYFDETYFMYYEDADFCSRCLSESIPLLVCSRAHLTHLVGQSDVTGKVYFQYAPANRIRWVRSTTPAWQSPFVIGAILLNYVFKSIGLLRTKRGRINVIAMWHGILVRKWLTK